MRLNSQYLSEAEKASLYYHVFAGVKDWCKLYAIATGIEDPENISRSTASRWKHSAKVQKYLAYLIQEKRNISNPLQAEATNKNAKRGEDSERTQTQDPAKLARLIDYTNPENQTTKLNELVNRAGDAGEALDALKVIISSQKADREAAREGKQVKTCLPMCCTECPLYQKAKKKVTL